MDKCLNSLDSFLQAPGVKVLRIKTYFFAEDFFICLKTDRIGFKSIL